MATRSMFEPPARSMAAPERTIGEPPRPAGVRLAAGPHHEVDVRRGHRATPGPTGPDGLKAATEIIAGWVLLRAPQSSHDGPPTLRVMNADKGTVNKPVRDWLAARHADSVLFLRSTTHPREIALAPGLDGAGYAVMPRGHVRLGPLRGRVAARTTIELHERGGLLVGRLPR